MKGTRFNPPQEWNPNQVRDRKGNDVDVVFNRYFLGLSHLAQQVGQELSIDRVKHPKMIEIGSYMGESTLIFGSAINWDTIYCIDPLSGEEEMNSISGLDWVNVRSHFRENTKWFNVEHIENYSYNVVDKFEDNSINFIYIDGNHTYEDVKRDIELYAPKLKTFGMLGGHDYDENWDGVRKAVDEVITNDKALLKFDDNSWLIKKVNTIL